jgi:hypothetical protein
MEFYMQVTNITTSPVQNILYFNLTVINMATARNCEVISDKFNATGIFISVNCEQWSQ